MRALLLILLAASAPVRADGLAEGRLAVDSTFYRGFAMPVTIEMLLTDAATPPGFEPLAGCTIAAAAGTDHWFLVDVGRELGDADPARDWSLRIDFTGLDRVEVFVAAGSELLYRGAVGDEVALGRWPLAARLPTIPLVVDGRLADRVFLHPAATGQPLVLPLSLVDARTRRADAMADQLWYGFFFGAALAFVAYTACLWLATRSVAYLVFAVYLSAFTTVILTTSGMGRLRVWPELDGFTTRFSLAAVALTCAAVTVFVERFLAPERDSVRLRRLLWSWAALALLPTLALPWVPYMRVQPAIHVVALLTLLLLTAVAVRRVRQGSRPARFLLAAYAVLFSGILLELARYNGLVPANLGGEHLVEVAVLFEALVLCVGLADAIAAIRARQRAAEARELAARERYTGRLIRAHESERRRFGAILHDDIGHGVATLRYGLAEALAPGGNRDGGVPRAELARLHEDCGAILEDLRRLARESHPHLLAQLGLDGALRSLFAAALDPLGVAWRVDCDAPGLPREAQEHLYRIAQECLTNALKHAEPAHVSLAVTRDGDALALEYEDDGTGADPAALGGEGDADGFGLVSIRERARLLGGRLTLRTGVDEGFALRVTGSVSGSGAGPEGAPLERAGGRVAGGAPGGV